MKFKLIIISIAILMVSCSKQAYKPQAIENVVFEELAKEYRNFHKQHPMVIVSKSQQVFPINNDFKAFPKKVHLLYGNKSKSDWIADFAITGLAVHHKGKMVFEEYYLGNEAASQAVAFSSSKSVVSTLIGIAIQDGLIESVDDPIDKYVPELSTSGYQGVSIKDILQMSSGINFDENDSSKDSEIGKYLQSLTIGSIEEYVASTTSRRPAGTVFEYQSINTQALSFLLRKVTGLGLNEYLQQKIWEPLGMEFDAFFRVDKLGVEMSSGHFTWPLRDRIRFGLLYLYEGNINGHQILNKQWITASHTADASHLKPNAKNEKMAYGYQFWLPMSDNGDGDYLAIGVRGQFIYINPKYETVIAVSAAFPSKGVDSYGLYVYQMIEIFRDIVRYYN